MKVTMNQKSSVVQILKSVPQVLKSDSRSKRWDQVDREVIPDVQLVGSAGEIETIMNSGSRGNVVGGHDTRMSPNKKKMLPCQEAHKADWFFQKPYGSELSSQNCQV